MIKFTLIEKIYHLIFLFGLVLAGCQKGKIQQVDQISVATIGRGPTISSGESTLEPYTFSTSIKGKVTVKGRLLVLDPVLMIPDPNDGIFLVPLPEGEGVGTIPPFVIGEVPQADVDERTGDFVFIDINPGKYAVVVLTTGGSQIPARLYEQGSLAIVNITENDLDQFIEIDFLSLP